MADFESATFRQGTADWNNHIMGKYTTANPIEDLLYSGPEREKVIATLFAFCDDYTTREGRDEMIDRLWPTEVPPPPGPPIKALELNKNGPVTAADFLNLAYKGPKEPSQGLRKRLSQVFGGGSNR